MFSFWWFLCPSRSKGKCEEASSFLHICTACVPREYRISPYAGLSPRSNYVLMSCSTLVFRIRMMNFSILSWDTYTHYMRHSNVSRFSFELSVYYTIVTIIRQLIIYILWTLNLPNEVIWILFCICWDGSCLTFAKSQLAKSRPSTSLLPWGPHPYLNWWSFIYLHHNF